MTDFSKPDHDSNCVFCRELSGSQRTNFSRLYPEIQSRFFWADDHFAGFPAIGQLVPGHSLIVTKDHVSNFASTIPNMPEASDQIFQLASKLAIFYDLPLENVLLFEHGALSEVDGGCGIYHAHIHLVPSRKRLNSKRIFDKSVNNSNEASHLVTLSDTLASLDATKPYIFVGDFSSGFLSTQLTTKLESQTIRRMVSRELGNTEWDWRSAKRELELTSFLSMMGEFN